MTFDGIGIYKLLRTSLPSNRDCCLLMGPTEYDPFVRIQQMMEPDRVSEVSRILNIPKMIHTAQHKYVIRLTESDIFV